MAKTIEELRNTPDEQLIREHDGRAKNTWVGTAYYLDELRRREAAGREATMVKLTWAIAIMTGVVTLATVVNVVVFFYGS